MWNPLLDSLVYFPDARLYGDPADASLAFTDLTIPTEDGETLHGWWIPTRTTPARGHVLFFHGNAGNISHRLDHAAALTGAGLDLLLVDYRGYGRSTGRPSERGLYRDARASLAALHAGGQVDPSRVVYMGESIGGAVALWLALEEPPLGLVLQSTFTSLRDVGRRHYPAALAALAADAFPNLDRIGRLRAPVLILHGDQDEIVPVDHARTLLGAAPEPRRLEIVQGAGHNDLVERMGRAYGQGVADWLP
ncbi:MAG TPA: alpha/beta hydrolase [Vicinamibacteria bacterium]|nr:alpha/beta hydrolase [Vicinamibacteria bacterium]